MNDNNWILLREALELAQMKPGTFSYHVRAGRVKTQEGVGPRDHRYYVPDILQLKDQRRARGKHFEKEEENLFIDWIKTSDVPSGLKLAQTLYDDDVDLADVIRYQAWRKYNPNISMGAFSLDRATCYAALMLVPLDESLIISVLSGKRLESSIEDKEIKRYDQPGNYTLLAASALCLPERPILLYRVMAKFMDFFVEMYPEKYISRIYAQTISDSGFMLVQHTFMTPRYDLADNAYMLDMARPSASKIIRRFQARLDMKGERPAGLQPYKFQ
ncbi:MAG TPA: hypothetical protein VFV38_19135 [Ktedonobacteraceae bacterium]|nr:hypothetical protein [Ktedonobacteraceae bacterium]